MKKRTTAALRTRLWLASGWGCLGRRLSSEKPDRGSGQSGKEHAKSADDEGVCGESAAPEFRRGLINFGVPNARAADQLLFCQDWRVSS